MKPISPLTLINHLILIMIEISLLEDVGHFIVELLIKCIYEKYARV